MKNKHAENNYTHFIDEIIGEVREESTLSTIVTGIVTFGGIIALYFILAGKFFGF